MTRSDVEPNADRSAVEVKKVSPHGIWLLAHGTEHFLRYADFLWFRDAPLAAIFNVEEPSPKHFYWPVLDVDLGLESVEQPERFPLVSA
jgi:hypothetical protein